MDRNSSMKLGLNVSERAEFRKIDKLEPQWLYDIRRKAWEYYFDGPEPERTSNVWRYTDPKAFAIANPAEQMAILPAISGYEPDVRPIPSEYAGFGYNRGDLRTFAQVLPELKSQGVIFKELYAAIREDNGLTQNYLGRLIGPEFGKFEALNMALWNSGLFLYIPDGVTIEKPIYLHRHPAGQNTLLRLLVVIGENAQATVIDDYACHCRRPGATANSAVEIYAGDSSNVRYVNIQRLGEDFSTYMTTRAEIKQNTALNSIFGSVGSGTAKVNAGAILDGRGANSQMYGIVFGGNGQHFDHHTVQRHKAGESFSNLNFKVALKDKALSAYTGLIRIEKETANCEAYQENRNLLLNTGARAESIPELEILTDQVRCTHGATMGPIDPEMVFYLKSRGIDEAEAIRSIVAGYIEPLLNLIPGDLREMMRELTENKLRGKETAHHHGAGNGDHDHGIH